jgi:transposase
VSNTAIEVITTVERRRRWSAAEKERLVAASVEPGSSVSAVARQAKIHPSQLYGWRRQLGVRRGAMSRFAAVRIAADPSPAGVLTPGMIEVEFTNGSRVRITGSVDPATLAAAVSVLNGAGRR